MICTTKNEEATIEDLLVSITSQTRLPEEIVFVDGGSSDNTTKIIENYIGKLPIKLIKSQNANIAQGRNFAIKNAKCDIIAGIDGGCRLDQNWLKNIVKPFEERPTIDCVSGVYLPWCKNEFEEVASHLIFPDIGKLEAGSFQPSGRSIAFKKTIWTKVGGFPEWLPTAEDTSFDLNLRKVGASFALAKDAIVYWRVRSRMRSIFKQFFNYAKGDGTAFLYPQRYIARYVAFAFLILSLWAGWWSPYVWLFLLSLVAIAFWLEYLRKIPRPSLKRIAIGSGIAFAMELGTSFGFVSGCLARAEHPQDSPREFWESGVRSIDRSHKSCRVFSPFSARWSLFPVALSVPAAKQL